VLFGASLFRGSEGFNPGLLPPFQPNPDLVFLVLTRSEVFAGERNGSILQSSANFKESCIYDSFLEIDT
jgi:hypothetical protein